VREDKIRDGRERGLPSVSPVPNLALLVLASLLCVIKLTKVNVLIVTSPARAVAKYCNQHVCQCVCVSVCMSVREHISRTAGAIFANSMCMLPVAVARSSPGGGKLKNAKITPSQREGVILAVFFLIGNALQSIWDPYETAELNRSGCLLG